MKKILFSILTILCLAACESEYERVFKQHLYSQLLDAQAMLDNATEGTGEGEHRPGSKATLETVIDGGYTLYWDAQATQQAVDDYCGTVETAVQEFNVAVNPSLSNLRSLLVQAQALVNIAEEHSISQADVGLLTESVDYIQDLLDNQSYIWSQEEVSNLEQELLNQIYAIENQIDGPISIHIENPSFEPNVTETEQVITDFTQVPGWTNAGYIEGVTPWDDLLSNSVLSKEHWRLTSKTVDGNYALYVQTYSRQVWQTLNENVRENCHYTVSLSATRSEWDDAAATKLQIQLVTFEGEAGDFDDMTVLAEQEFSNISQDNFQTYTMTYWPSDNFNRQITLCLRCYYNTPANNSNELAWKDVGVAVDAVTMKRERNN